MRLAPFIAYRHLRTRLRSTLLTAAGVALGVAVMSIMASLLLGLQSQLIQNIIETTPNVTVEGTPAVETRRVVAIPSRDNTIVDLSRRPPPDEDEGIPNYQQVVRQIEGIPGVAAAAPVLTGQALLRYGTRGRPVVLTGIEPEQQARTLIWRERLQQQQGDLATTTNGAVIGYELAKDLGIPSGANITLLAGPDRRQRMRVVALYRSGIRPIDETVVYVNLRMAQTLLDRPSEVSEIDVRIDEVNAARVMAQRIAAATGLQAKGWQEVNANFFSIFRLQNTMTSLMIMFIVVIAGFGITNGLITVILEKQRDIGILKALGTVNRSVEAIFLLEGLIMGLIGVLLGIGLAYLGISNLDNLPLGGEGQLSTATTFTMLRTPWIYIIPALLALGVSMVASLLPVRRAARYDPVEIIRSSR